MLPSILSASVALATEQSSLPFIADESMEVEI